MKIAYILPSLAAKAPVFIAKRLSDFFISKGNIVEVFYFDEIFGTEFNCKTTHIKISEPIDFDSFDIIHSHMMRPDFYVAKFSSKIKKAKTISTVHCNIKEDLKYSYGNLVSFIYTRKWISALKKIDRPVQINDYLLAIYKHELPKSQLIYNGISVTDEKDDYSEILNKISNFKQKNLKVLCSYSGIIQRKGLLQILELLKIRSDFAYVCIGEGEQKSKLIKFATDNNIAERCYFSPFKKNPYNVMENADVFVIPSYSEGFSLAMLEAGTIGSSIVCSDIPAFNLPFSRNEVSFFKLNNIKSLEIAVDEALKLKEEKTKLLQKKIKTCFSEDVMFLQYENLYKKLK
ncbi:MAG: glycosyltransferase family 4 protein [Treponema sp.]|nr:glycosyltransferase family 4 protein [Treponema sp.]